MCNSITLIGMAGAGKTSVGKVLSSRLDKRFIDSDHEIESELSMTLQDILFKKGKDKFLEIEKQSILNLSNIRNNQQKYVLLGDMLELGKKSEVLHKNLSPIINQSKINKIFIHGHHIMNTYKNVNKKLTL